MSESSRDLTSSGLLARNVIWNLVGAGAPLIVAVVAIPNLIEGLGKERFGILSLAWVMVGYFSLFDLGLGRALTKMVAEKLGAGQDDHIPSLVWTALSLMVGLGLIGASVIAALAPRLVGGVLNIPAALQPETLKSFYLLAASVPIVIGATGFRGVLEARQLFGLVNAVRIPLGIYTFLGPLAVLPFSHSLFPIVIALVLGRVAYLLTFMILCLRTDPTLRRIRLDSLLLRPLLGFGGWMTVTNLVGPLMVYLDRFLIGAMVTMTSVAYYTTPYEMISRLRIIPTAMMGVLFPAFAATFNQDRARAYRLFGRAVTYVFLTHFPIVLVVVGFAYEGLALWLGPEFAQASTRVLQLLAVGTFINSLAHVPFGMIQGAGRPDLTAKLHLCELPFYLVILWWLVGQFGIIGAAMAWLIRVIVDMGGLFWMARRVLGIAPTNTVSVVLVALSALAAMVVGALIDDLLLKCVYLMVVLVGFGIYAWTRSITASEKILIREVVTARFGRGRNREK